MGISYVAIGWLAVRELELHGRFGYGGSYWTSWYIKIAQAVQEQTLVNIQLISGLHLKSRSKYKHIVTCLSRYQLPQTIINGGAILARGCDQNHFETS
jgi:hypothetical protein